MGIYIELTDALWDDMIISSVDPAGIVKHNNKKAKDKNNVEKKPKTEESQQLSLFDMEDFDE